ncbi:MAG: hypothetical protein ACJASM_001405 [Salibacteraceae bacterium]|jgi:hypothetical protein|tara:strand:- start:455 stop:2329 length:1875 start_codon:yes stop_codon:yes gene_type:complete
MSFHKYSLLISLLIISYSAFSQVPKVYTNISLDKGNAIATVKGKEYPETNNGKGFQLQALIGNPIGTQTGVKFNFGPKVSSGTVYFGLINPTDGKYPMPVFFKSTAAIVASVAEVDLIQLKGKYDMSGWEKSNGGFLGYRVVGTKGKLLYDGRLSFKLENGKFLVPPSIIEGPTINQLTDNSVVISLELNKEGPVILNVNDTKFESKGKTSIEFKVEGLEPNTTYDYEVEGVVNRNYSFKTNPVKGDRSPFVFAYTSDSRAGQGGGERDLYGANYYVMQRIVAYSKAKNVAFLQFTGDMINGYLSDKQEMNLQYANWKRSLEPYASFFPVNVAMGNHEALVNYFSNPETAEEFGIDRFPFETESAEAVFATNFSNPVSELKSEDGAAYDPDPKTKDFPPYDETVFSYVHGNAAVVVLNSNYWYAYALNRYPGTSGNIHAYIMDNQLEWFKDELTKYESDKDIDHVFVTLHTPFFPNGGHVADDMWYNGKNWPRPIVAGEKVEKGIIERRDELLEVMINKSSKVRAVLSGDEHNYAKTKITEAMPRYPENWEKPKLKLTRTIYQINNGSAGAPYYAKEQTPWSDFTTNFSTQNVVVLLNVDGKSVNVEVRNPFTEELVDALELAK